MDEDEAHGLGPEPAGVRSVVVVLPGGLGAVVDCTPALRHLRTTYVNAAISVVAGESTRGLLVACPFVDRYIAIERPSEALVESFDIAISLADPADAHEGVSITAITARTLVQYRNEGESSTCTIAPVIPRRLARAAQMLRLVWIVGGDQPGSRTGLWPTLLDRNGAADLCQAIADPFAVLHPFAGAADRRWPNSRYAAVIAALSSRGLATVIVGSRSDLRCEQQIHELVSAGATSLVGRTSVGELAGVLERAAMFVGNDSGPASFARSLDVWSVVIGARSPFVPVGIAGGRITVVAADVDPVMSDVDNVSLEVVLAEVLQCADRALRDRTR